MTEANHVVGMLCSRYGCGKVSTVDTPMGSMCQEHASPLMFALQLEPGDIVPAFVPWRFVAPHDERARRNHSQSLARLSERGGLDVKELLAVLEDRPYLRADERDEANRKVTLLLKEWHRQNS